MRYGEFSTLQLENSVTDESVANICSQHATDIEHVGYIVPMPSLKDKPKLIRSIKLHHVLLKNKAELDQMISGMEKSGLLTEIRKTVAIFEPLFIASKMICLTSGWPNTV